MVEDNSLADVVLQPRGIPPVATFSRTGRVLTLGSLSKVAWGGLRVGWLRGPAEFVDPLGRLKAATDFGMSVLPQVTALRAYSTSSPRSPPPAARWCASGATSPSSS